MSIHARFAGRSRDHPHGEHQVMMKLGVPKKGIGNEHEVILSVSKLVVNSATMCPNFKALGPPSSAPPPSVILNLRGILSERHTVP